MTEFEKLPAGFWISMASDIDSEYPLAETYYQKFIIGTVHREKAFLQQRVDKITPSSHRDSFCRFSHAA